MRKNTQFYQHHHIIIKIPIKTTTVDRNDIGHVGWDGKNGASTVSTHKSINGVLCRIGLQILIFQQGWIANPAELGAYLVTGNLKHFPKKPIVVTPSEMIQILEDNGVIEKEDLH
jgi:hypothetical protein